MIHFRLDHLLMNSQSESCVPETVAWIQDLASVTREYIPGKFGSPHPDPKLVIPTIVFLQNAK